MLPKRAIIKHWPGFDRIKGVRVALTVGIFDGVHQGHLRLFTVLREVAADFGGIPLIFTFENHPLTILKPEKAIRYLTLVDERILLLNRLGFPYIACFQFTPTFSKMTARKFLGRIKEYVDLRALIVGYDASLGSDRISSDKAYRQLASDLAFEFIRIPAVKIKNAIVSSKAIRNEVMRGNLSSANNKLVYPFFVRGKVEAGRGIGKKVLRTPTANIYLPEEKILPPDGVYGGALRKGTRYYPAVICISDAHKVPKFLGEAKAKNVSKPDLTGKKLVEAHIIGKKIDLLHTTCELLLLEKIRGWIDFESSHKLAEQIKSDIRESIKVYEKNKLKLRFLP